MTNTALCGLGKSAAGPVVSTLKYFREEYLSHVVGKICPSHVCTALKVYEIEAEKCRGCSKCARQCPVGAISGTVKSPYTINTNTCIKCGACVDSCAFKAIREV